MKTAALKKRAEHPPLKGQTPSLETPGTHRCRWLKNVLGLSDNEMAMALNVSHRTLANWLEDPEDSAARESVRFDRLLRLTEHAKGLVKAEALGTWLHKPKKDLGDIVPVFLLGDEAGYKKIIGILEEARSGVLD